MVGARYIRHDPLDLPGPSVSATPSSVYVALVTCDMIFAIAHFLLFSSRAPQELLCVWVLHMSFLSPKAGVCFSVNVEEASEQMKRMDAFERGWTPYMSRCLLSCEEASLLQPWLNGMVVAPW